MIVLDASAGVELLLNSARGRRVARVVSESPDTLHAPHLIDLEVVQVLRRYHQMGLLSLHRARAAIGEFRALRMRRHPHEPFLRRIWSLKDNLTAYDAAYVALCEALDATLLTFDRRLAGVPGLPVRCQIP